MNVQRDQHDVDFELRVLADQLLYGLVHGGAVRAFGVGEEVEHLFPLGVPGNQGVLQGYIGRVDGSGVLHRLARQVALVPDVDEFSGQEVVLGEVEVGDMELPVLSEGYLVEAARRRRDDALHCDPGVDVLEDLLHLVERHLVAGGAVAGAPFRPLSETEGGQSTDQKKHGKKKHLHGSTPQCSSSFSRISTCAAARSLFTTGASAFSSFSSLSRAAIFPFTCASGKGAAGRSSVSCKRCRP